MLGLRRREVWDPLIKKTELKVRKMSVNINGKIHANMGPENTGMGLDFTLFYILLQNLTNFDKRLHLFTFFDIL
jgi:hypothetical protein